MSVFCSRVDFEMLNNVYIPMIFGHCLFTLHTNTIQKRVKEMRWSFVSTEQQRQCLNLKEKKKPRREEKKYWTQKYNRFKMQTHTLNR